MLNRLVIKVRGNPIIRDVIINVRVFIKLKRWQSNKRDTILRLDTLRVRMGPLSI